MEITIERLHRDIVGLRREVELIKHMLEENYELSEKTKKDAGRGPGNPGI